VTDNGNGRLPRKNVAVVLASGIGQRSEFSRPKQLMKLGGRPVMAHALARFQSHEGIDEIAIVTNQLCLGEVEDLVPSAFNHPSRRSALTNPKARDATCACCSTTRSGPGSAIRSLTACLRR
jgi:2-C-methyl-D-erythritol 4-phosphate cytidylyltransferase